MENCFNTNLKSVIADPEKKMEYADSFIVTAYINSANEAVNLLSFNDTQGTKITCTVADGDFEIFNANLGVYVNTITVVIPALNGVILQGRANSVGPVRVRILNSSDRNGIDTISSIYKVDINRMHTYFPNIKRITACTTPNNPPISFVSTPAICNNLVQLQITSRNEPALCNINLSHFSNAINLTTLTLQGSNNVVTGSITSLAKSTLMTSLQIYNKPAITGEVNTLAAAQVANGRTSGILTITCGNSAVTLDGTIVPYGVKIHFDSSAAGGYTTELYNG